MAMRMHWRRRLATGANAVIATIFLVTAGVLGLEVLARAHWQLDLSENADSTLSPELDAVLLALQSDPRPMTVTAFSAQQKDEEARARDRITRDFLRELEARSDRIETDFVDFDADRMTVERMHVSRYGTIVVEGRGNRVDITDREVFRASGPKGARQLTFLGEQAVARAIGKILSGRELFVYSLVGHGEKRFDDAVNAVGALKGLSEQFLRQGWKSKPLDLLRDRKEGGPIGVPANAAAVVIVGPKAPLAAEEEQALAAYVSGGGRVAYFTDPGGFVPDFLDHLGVVVPSGLVLDPTYVYPAADRPILRYGRHAITEPLGDNAPATFVASAAPVEVKPPGDGAVSPLLQTSRAGWIERGLERPAEFTAGQDAEGPVTVAAAVELRASPQAKPTRLLVFGDTDMVQDDLLSEGPGNAAFVVNAMRWLIGEEDRMLKGGRPVASRKLQMSPEQVSGVRWVVLAFLPLCAVVVGAIVAWLRRER